MAETKRSTNKKSTSTGKSAKKSTTGKGKKTTKTSTDTAAMRAVADAEKGGTMISTRAICALVTLEFSARPHFTFRFRAYCGFLSF